MVPEETVVMAVSTAAVEMTFYLPECFRKEEKEEEGEEVNIARDITGARPCGRRSGPNPYSTFPSTVTVRFWRRRG